MPLYDCMLLLKPTLERQTMLELLSRLGRRVYALNGVVANIKSFGKLNLGYGIRKVDGKYYQGHMMQITMMVTPKFHSELHYLNKDSRMLRWLLIKHREDSFHGEDLLNLTDAKENLFGNMGKSNLLEDDDIEDDDDEEYELEETFGDRINQGQDNSLNTQGNEEIVGESDK